MKTWLLQVAEKLPGFINSLSDHSIIGKFYPCKTGATQIGKEASLGFSCFALKLYYILRLWENLDNNQQDKWLEFIDKFQNPQITLGHRKLENAFVDPILIKNAYDYFRYPMQFLYHMSIQSKDIKKIITPKFNRQNLTNPITVILAETKQTIATLSEINHKPTYPFLSFPQHLIAYTKLFQPLIGENPGQPVVRQQRTPYLLLLKNITRPII
jgi:hypothetical protein